MNVVDSSGWLEYFTNGENAGFFAPAIEDSENLIVPAICVYEVFKRLLQEVGESRALVNVGDMYTGQIAELTAPIALIAARISVEMKLAMADSVILATSRAYEAVLWTQDADFEGMEKVKFVGPGPISRRRRRKDQQ
ncbi:MAG TPA: type II toxin-antitoxin system VapC family toxin [Anaerolineales bacterium]|nr:type II toxin-antitoxin system VapC family toxin [Anaerolineales bacterium]